MNQKAHPEDLRLSTLSELYSDCIACWFDEAVDHGTVQYILIQRSYLLL
jgi:hypothetical protein